MSSKLVRCTNPSLDSCVIERTPFKLGPMGELSLEGAGDVRQRTISWQDPLVGAAPARDLSGLEYLTAEEPARPQENGHGR